MIKSLTYEILKKVWSDSDLSGSIFDQLVEVAVREGEQRQADRIEALEAALRTLINEHEVLGFVGGPSAEAWDAARAAVRNATEVS